MGADSRGAACAPTASLHDTMPGWTNNHATDGSIGPRIGLLTSGLNPRQGGFASVELNAVGWLALLSPGVVLGLLFARLTGRSFVVFGLIGGVLIWGLAVGLERAFAGNRPSRMQISPPLKEVELSRVEEAARHAGIAFTHRLSESEDGPESVLETKTKFGARLHNIVEIHRED